jgi:DNA-binding transcriptional ArsR family regulator
MRLTGLRGVGKSVLLGEFEDIAEQNDWASALLELQPGHNTDEALVTALTKTATQAKERLSRMERLRRAVGKKARRAGTLGVGWGEFVLTYTPLAEQAQEDLSKSLYEVVEAAVEKGRDGFILLLDETQVIRDEHKATGEHPLSLLISSVVALQREELPLGLVVCGLPTLTPNLLRARSYTERMFRGEEIGRLAADDAAEAFIEPIAETTSSVLVSEHLIENIVDEVEGYPYFIQLWGAELWDAADAVETDRLDEPLLEAARPDILRRLDLDFYEPRVATLTPAEQDVLLATAEIDYPPLIVSQLNEAVDKTPANVNVLLGRLVENGVLHRLRKGQYEYTAPKFRDYLLRRVKA